MLIQDHSLQHQCEPPANGHEFQHLVRWLSPSLIFTCEEAWQARGNITSIHLEDFMFVDQKFENIDLNDKWIAIKNIRKVITGALEKKRAEKVIGSSLEAHIKVFVTDELKRDIVDVNLDEISITSSFEILPFDDKTIAYAIEDIKDVRVAVEKVEANKCQRCWKYVKNITEKNICNRCEKTI